MPAAALAAAEEVEAAEAAAEEEGAITAAAAAASPTLLLRTPVTAPGPREGALSVLCLFKLEGERGKEEERVFFVAQPRPKK